MDTLQSISSFIATQTSFRDKAKETKQEMAMEFERMFAQHLVDELTKGSFKISDNTYGSASFNIHRSQITETLANELAAQKKLGMADLVLKHWNKAL